MNVGGKKIIVTGGVRGLGRCIVDSFAALAASVTVFDVDEDGLEQLKQQQPALNCVPCDVSNYEDVAAKVHQYCSDFGSPDVLINNAGILYSAPLVKVSATGLETHDVRMWDKVIMSDLSSVFYVTSCVIGKMITSRTRGVIVNISSVSASGNAGQSAYSAAKAGVNALTTVWAKELSALGIRVIGIAPGFIETESTKAALSETVLQDTIKRVPLRRLGKPQEIADGVLFAVQNEFVNGKVLALDGGLVL